MGGGPLLRQQLPPIRRKVPVLGSAEPHLGPHALGVPVAPLGHRDRRRTIDEQARLGANPLQVRAVGEREVFRRSAPSCGQRADSWSNTEDVEPERSVAHR